MLTYQKLDAINWERAQRGQPRLSMHQAERAMATPNGRAVQGDDLQWFLVGLALLSGVAGAEAVPADPPPLDNASIPDHPEDIPGNDDGDAGAGGGNDDDGCA